MLTIVPTVYGLVLGLVNSKTSFKLCSYSH